jgi:hypothetical protein
MSSNVDPLAPVRLPWSSFNVNRTLKSALVKLERGTNTHFLQLFHDIFYHVDNW